MDISFVSDSTILLSSDNVFLPQKVKVVDKAHVIEIYVSRICVGPDSTKRTKKFFPLLAEDSEERLYINSIVPEIIRAKRIRRVVQLLHAGVILNHISEHTKTNSTIEAPVIKSSCFDPLGIINPIEKEVPQQEIDIGLSQNNVEVLPITTDHSTQKPVRFIDRASYDQLRFGIFSTLFFLAWFYYYYLKPKFSRNQCEGDKSLPSTAESSQEPNSVLQCFIIPHELVSPFSCSKGESNEQVITYEREDVVVIPLITSLDAKNVSTSKDLVPTMSKSQIKKAAAKEKQRLIKEKAEKEKKTREDFIMKFPNTAKKLRKEHIYAEDEQFYDSLKTRAYVCQSLLAANRDVEINKPLLALIKHAIIAYESI